MAKQNFKLTETQRYLRGILFIAAGAFMMIRFAARDSSNIFFLYASWFTAVVALGALALYIWSVFQEI